MLVTESGIIIEVRLSHPLNAYEPILVIESGIDIEVRLLHNQNASEPMLVTPYSIRTFVILFLLLDHGGFIV